MKRHQESLWYFAYAVVLWAVVIVGVALEGSAFRSRRGTGGHQPAGSLSATASS